ncbi:MAG: WYL domain-containing protein [Streptosporangiales bacterium]|nr:WYL domain-containing protein [Streptosporangiales bacterium]
MLETSARLLRLLSLLQAHREWGGGELAGRLGVTTRTVRRDVDRLRSLGYPVHATPGIAGGYRLGAGAALPPLLLDDDEAVAVAVALQTAAGGGIAGLGETSVRALAKLEQVLPSRLRHRVSGLSGVVALSYSGPTIAPEVLTAAATACRDHQRLRFDYRATTGRTTTRTVEPDRLANAGRRWYLLAWDVDRKDWRTFRMDRIEGVPSLRERFTPREPPAEDMETYLSTALSSAPYPYQARVTLHMSKEEASQHVAATVGVLEAIDANTCELRLGANELVALGWIVGSIGAEFEIHEPPELAEHLRALGERLVRAANRDAADEA